MKQACGVEYPNIVCSQLAACPGILAQHPIIATPGELLHLRKYARNARGASSDSSENSEG
jgi:hypothetical protein